ncbi:uncharacterized protein LTR77_005870 [Saxophila tyrrhenica]|uniref:Tubulin-tyrosine ligase n=1 Tax=Saxophila tyrrhenica TaxID=1690608 RepID=A0AAV9PDR8_9PEZI|nr:hypothetical protein LTR77_005870 [Saxophila tyrrhenica]
MSNTGMKPPEDASERIHALVHYEDDYVQPLLMAALKARLPPEIVHFVEVNTPESPLRDLPDGRLLQWRQYESTDFDHVLSHTATSLANSYIIRKALIRKHYLSTTVAHWVAKHPSSLLKNHVKPAVEFELDYAEFLDDALDQAEAWELRESWRRNESLEDDAKVWWILKPGMSERGQGIRLFSSEEELQAIFEEWDPADSDDEAEEQPDDIEDSDQAGNSNGVQPNGVRTSHLRHFIAQPYIHPPLLLSQPHPSADRKFHIRTYVLAAGALRVCVCRRMLALFAAEYYVSPASDSASPNEDLSAHLTNTCLQSGEREGSVRDFWSLPSDIQSSTLDSSWKDNVFEQICAITGEVFEAAARGMSIHFQTLPNAFEIFGLDFLVDAEGTAWLLEVNAFPDFKQTGEKLQGVVKGLMEGVIDVAVAPFFGVEIQLKDGTNSDSALMKVLDIDLGRR